jgi:hypothetical protein
MLSLTPMPLPSSLPPLVFGLGTIYPTVAAQLKNINRNIEIYAKKNIYRDESQKILFKYICTLIYKQYEKNKKM